MRSRGVRRASGRRGLVMRVGEARCRGIRCQIRATRRAAPAPAPDWARGSKQRARPDEVVGAGPKSAAVRGPGHLAAAGRHGAGVTTHISISAVPVAPFAPSTTAVYAPGAAVIRTADSFGLAGARPEALTAAWLLAVCQPLFEATWVMPE